MSARSRSLRKGAPPTRRRSPGTCSLGDERAQVGDRLAQLLPLDVEPRERHVQAALALLRQAEIRDAPVLARLPALDEPALLGAADELRDGALRELQPARELRHGRLTA